MNVTSAAITPDQIWRHLEGYSLDYGTVALTTSLQNVLNITGRGVLVSVTLMCPNGSYGIHIKLTIDGSVEINDVLLADDDNMSPSVNFMRGFDTSCLLEARSLTAASGRVLGVALTE